MKSFESDTYKKRPSSRSDLFRFSLFALFLVFGFESSMACMYGPPYRTVCQTYTEADAVVIGKIESVEGIRDVQTVVVDVEKTFKGRNQKKIVLHQPLSTCDWNFSDEVGRTLLLYLWRNEKTGKYSAIGEGMGGRVERQSENLYWLNDLPKSLNRTRISGEANLYRDQAFEFLQPVTGMKVRVFNEKNSFEVSTDQNGVYQIWDIPAGKYRIEPSLPVNPAFRVELERGLVDFDTLRKENSEQNRVLIEIGPQGCGAIDFVFSKKSEDKKTTNPAVN